jgi:hypothetical protein
LSGGTFGSDQSILPGIPPKLANSNKVRGTACLSGVVGVRKKNIQKIKIKIKIKIRMKTTERRVPLS